MTKRKETKYFVKEGQYCILKSLLQAVLEPDPFANEEGEYFVRSLYFDSIRNMDIKDKEMGALHRRKIRLRCYDPQAEDFKFETKEKINKHTVKKSLRFTKEEVLPIIDGDYTNILMKAPKLYDHMLSRLYVPKVLVDYEREAYISDLFKVRINFDKNIRGHKGKAVFDGDASMIPLIDPDLYILEIKHDGHLPDFIRRIIASVDLSPVSYSKYYYGGLL